MSTPTHIPKPDSATPSPGAASDGTPPLAADTAAAKAARAAARAARTAARAAAKERRRQAALQELGSIENVQERIDRVAADLNRRRKRYKDLTAQELIELLEAGDPEGLSDEWGALHLRRKLDLDDSGDSYPLAEHVGLLENKVTPERWQEISEEAEQILENDEGPDLKLTRKEEAALRKAYSEQHLDDGGMILLICTLQATNGDELIFEGVIGESGSLDELRSPYENGFDTTNYVYEE
jgi:hypothetical protein